MNLVQKLPIGLGLACVMMLSSCSKEDVQVAQPQDTEQKVLLGQDASFRSPVVNGPWISPTQGPVTGNVNSYSSMSNWSMQTSELAGISNYKYVLGDPLAPWESPLPIVFPGPSTFLTLKAVQYQNGWTISTIKGLTPGKKYKVTFSLSTSRPKGSQTPYVEQAEVFVHTNAQNPKKVISFSGKHGQWINDSITFVAEEDQHGFNVYNPMLLIDATAYLNIIVGPNAIQQLD